MLTLGSQLQDLHHLASRGTTCTWGTTSTNTGCCLLLCWLQAKPATQGKLTRKEFNDVLDK